MTFRMILLLLVASLAACQSSEPEVGNPSTIRNQADADAYNALVSNEAEKLECRREKIMGSIRSRTVCMTRARWDSLQSELSDIRDHDAVMPR